MQFIWDERAWEDYLFWQETNKQFLKKINLLLKDIKRSHYDGIGKTEPLKGNWSGWWSRRIDSENRVIYQERDGNIIIAVCKGHYE